MDWLDFIHKLLSVMVNSLRLHEYYRAYYPGLRQWLRNRNWPDFWNKVNYLLKYLASAETALLVVVLLLAGTEFFIRHYSPAMPASALADLGRETLSGVTVGGLAIKGFWHYAMKLASL